MKVIFAIRHDYLSHFGGDVVQMQKTKLFLEKNYDVKIVVCHNETMILENKDASLMHIFNIQTIEESYRYMLLAKELNIPMTLSTIYWDLSDANYIQKLEAIGKIRPVTFGKKNVFSLVKFLRRKKEDESYLSKSYFEKTRELVMAADVLLPNSNEELQEVAREFGLNHDVLEKKTIVVPNAVDITEGDHSPNLEIHLPEKFVLEVARIEPIKNQLNVILALYDSPEIPIVFAGTEIEGKYLEEVKRIGTKRGNVYFLGRVPHEELSHIYQQAAVHILPSFRESPGLSSLEALYNGCNIVVSDKKYCPIGYYQFDKYGEICNPYKIKSIKKAILKAIDKKNQVPKEYFQQYSYDEAAKQTYHAYCELLKKTGILTKNTE